MRGRPPSRWARSWLVAGLGWGVAGPGQFITFEIGAESLIVARGIDGKLRAMHNACTHRGTRLVSEPFGPLRKFVCPYHAWAYGLYGSLQGVPGAGRFSNGPPTDELPLPAVDVREPLGVAIVRRTPGGMP